MAKINVESGGTILSSGLLQLSGGAAMSGTLTAVTDQNNTASQLKLATNLTQVAGTLQIALDGGAYIDAQDTSGIDRFNVNRSVGSQQVNVDFSSNPTSGTDAVGALRTYANGSALSEAMTFLRNGNVGVGTTSPADKVVITTTGSGNNLLLNNSDSVGSPAKLTYNSSQSTLRLSNAYSSVRITSVGGNYDVAILENGGAAGYLRLNQNGGSSNVYLEGLTSGYSYFLSQLGVGTATTLGAKMNIKGSGSTSATTSLLVQNSVGTAALQVADNGNTSLGSPNFNDRLEVYGNILVRANDRIRLAGTSDGNTALYATSGASAQINVKNGSGSTFDVTFGSIGATTRMLRVNSYDSTTPCVVVGNNATSIASAILQADSTTQGFLPPRMTNAQRLAIATPAVGLMVYCTDAVEGLYVYKSTGWTFVI